MRYKRNKRSTRLLTCNHYNLAGVKNMKEEKESEQINIIQDDYSIKTPLQPGTKVSWCFCEEGVLKLRVHHT